MPPSLRPAAPRQPSVASAGAIVDRLLAWYARHARPLPWRKTTDPYAIWISEIMVQQTQVETVLPYYRRWMRRLPGLKALAAAPPALLLQLWAGLGYYRRVRHIHAAARIIQNRHTGVFPRDFDDILDLPGIGRYTAGAISSIAFNQPAPILDGNVIRVLTRLLALPGDPRAEPRHSQLWLISRELVETANATQPRRSLPCGRLNQALMELGALVCTPRRPRCPLCPLRRFCLAAKSGDPTAFPTPRPRPVTETRRYLVWIVCHNSRVLVRRQPDSEWNAGLWGFPSAEIQGGTIAIEERARQLLQLPVGICQPLGQVRHSITRYRLLLEVHQVQLTGPPRTPREGERWCRPAALRDLAFAAAHKKVLRLARLLPPGRGAVRR